VSPAPDGPVRVRLKYSTVDTFVEKFAPNVTRGGIFLASREPRAVGSTVRFEICLMDGSAVLSGEGRVTWVKPYNPNERHRPHGMGVQFTVVDPSSRPVLERLLQRRELNARITAAVPMATAASRADARPTEPLETNEFDVVEDSALRRMVDRARVLSSPTDDVEDLLKNHSDEPTDLAQALSELPRYLASRRNSGLFRIQVEPSPPGESGSASGPTAAEPETKTGTSS
jgi:uncharacterized protein (TIGR02266 family)